MSSPARRTPVLLVPALLLVAVPLLGGAPAAARVAPGPGGDSRASAADAGLVSQAPGAQPAATVAGRSVPPRPAATTRGGGWPLRPDPEVVSRFAPPPVAWAAGHRGADLLGTPGQRVHIARPGTVTFAGRIAGRGVVVVSHGDTRTTYEPVTAAVARGDVVAQGAVLGRLELLGSHCLPRACLHWGLLRGETYLDPLTLVGRGAVRLLPWLGLGR